MPRCRSSNAAVAGIPSPGIFDAQRFPLGLLSLIIGGGMASRLFVEVRERRGLTYGIDAGETAIPTRVCGAWSGSARLAGWRRFWSWCEQRSPTSLRTALPRMSWREPRARCGAKRRSPTRPRQPDGPSWGEHRTRR